MAGFVNEGVCSKGYRPMMSKPNNAPTRVALGDRPRPVRVRVFRADGKIAKAHPPDGEGENWWRRLNEALGTTCDFVNG